MGVQIVFNYFSRKVIFGIKKKEKKTSTIIKFNNLFPPKKIKINNLWQNIIYVQLYLEKLKIIEWNI